jgi:hypothetical protein
MCMKLLIFIPSLQVAVQIKIKKSVPIYGEISLDENWNARVLYIDHNIRGLSVRISREEVLPGFCH